MKRFALLLLLALTGSATPAFAAEVQASVYFEPPPTPTHSFFSGYSFWAPYEVRTYVRRDYYYRPRYYRDYERDYDWRPVYYHHDQYRHDSYHPRRRHRDRQVAQRLGLHDSARHSRRGEGPDSGPGVQPAMNATDGDGAVLFGVQEVGVGGDRDVFKLGREYGRFARLRLRALGTTVPITEMRVIYAGGEPDVLAVNAELAADQRTGWLELKGDRFIRELHFVYPSQARRGKARLEVYGEYADSWFQPGSGSGAFASANNGWLYLGGQSPLFLSIRRGLGYETDVVSVARNRGFRSLRLDVKNRAITLSRIKVIYADGSSDVFAERQRVAGGASFGPVELKAKLPVKQIEISHRSRIFDSQAEGSGYAFVEFWAR